MDMQKKGLAVLCGIAAALMAATWMLFAVTPDVSQFIWDYIADPAVLVLLALIILVNLRDSLRIRHRTGLHLARDVITALEAMFGFRYLLQYVAKLAPAQEPVNALWAYLDSVMIVLLAAEAIALWRSAQRNAQHRDD